MSSCQSTILGKRKAAINGDLVLHLTSAVVNDLGPKDAKKQYRCTYHGCEKTYSKPSRLEEHERSHTGQRPFICTTCGKSYLRETHLQAHARSHLPNEMRPLSCGRIGCEKKFWTSQHLRVHLSWHDGLKRYQCQNDGCEESFAKHHQLRSHICADHASLSTEPFHCEHEGCSKSFATIQHLRTHHKTHDANRYTCSHPSCLSENKLKYFATWSSLQSHIKKDHPPTCPHLSCQNKTFSNAANLRGHLKLHEQRKVEDDLQKADERDEEAPVSKRRRGGECGRDWKCQTTGCDKEYKSEKALQLHTNVEHQSRRDFSCTLDDCSLTFSYKHLLQRHIAKVHTTFEPSVASLEISDVENEEDYSGNIDLITGNLYAKRAEEKLKLATALRCPYPELDGLFDGAEGEGSSTPASSSTPQRCPYVFTRGYDLKRHLSSAHSVVVPKDVVDGWTKSKKQAS